MNVGGGDNGTCTCSSCQCPDPGSFTVVNRTCTPVVRFMFELLHIPHDYRERLVSDFEAFLTDVGDHRNN